MSPKIQDTGVLKKPLPVSQAKQKVQATKDKLQTPQIPSALGGIISSDSWVVYQSKQQEEFKGNVNYENDSYAFRSDYALSERKKNLFTARGNVYLKQKEKNGAFYEATGHQATYNYQTGAGTLTERRKKRIRLFYKSPKSEEITATADKADFNTRTEIYNLYGKVVIVRKFPEEGTTTLKANKVSVRKADNYAILEGDAEVITPQYRLDAKTIEYDGHNNQSYAYGDRPLTTGTMEDGTFAIIADRIEGENESRKIVLKGNVHGWIVSDRINESDFNDKF